MCTQHPCKNLGSVALPCITVFGEMMTGRNLGIAEPVSFIFKDLISKNKVELY